MILLTLCLAVTASSAQSLPIVVSQGKTLGYFPAGGWSAGQTPLSGTFAIGPNGDVLVTDEWGNDLLDITPGGTVNKLAAISNSGPTAVDQYGNAYAAPDGYNGSIFKLPYDPTKGAYIGFTTAPTTNCVGGTQDAAPCLYAPNFKSVFTNGSGYTDLIFDASGNLFIATSTVPTDNPNSIYKCDLTCQTSATGTPSKIYADSKPLGALAIDPWGNLFFSDGANGSPGGITYLKELPLQSGTYAAAPTTLWSYTNKAGYSNGFSGVAVDGNGTIFFVTNADGIFAILNSQAGGPNLASLFKVANGGGYGIALDRKGNLYLIHYAGSPPSGSANYAVDQILVNNLSLAATAIGGTATTAAATVIDNNASCTPTLTMAASQFGVASTEFTVQAGTDCAAAVGTMNGTLAPSATLTGAVTSATITFNPAAVGPRNAALVIADSAKSATGIAALTGVGQNWMANLDPGVAKAFSTGFTTPASVIADAAGDLFIADSGAGKVVEIAAGATALTPIGTGFTTPSALAFDGNGNLFIADSGIPAIFEIHNTGTTGAFTAGAQSTVVSSTTLFGSTALGNPAGLAVGPDGLLYIADLSNSRVVTFNPSTFAPALTPASSGNGVKSPAGVALDAAGNLYVADDSLNQVFVFAANGTISSVAPSAVKEAVGVAVDASGSVLIADKSNGNIVRVPASSGTLDTSKAIVIEKNPQSAQSIWLDAAGNLYTADSAAKAVFAIQRTTAAIDIGTVQDGLTNTGTIYLMNAGNASVTLGTPAVTEPSNTMFTLAAASTNGCTDGTTGPAGALCQLIATFAPPVATPDGAQSGSATINFSPSGTATVSMTGTASVSSVQPQTITGLAPASPILIGRQLTLSASGGASGNPIVFTIDSSSACKTCAVIVANTLSATAAGTIVVDANQAGGANQGVQYAAASQVQATIVIGAASPAGVPSLLMTQQSWKGNLPAGGAFAQDSQAGSSFGVNPNGQVVLSTAYGGKVVLYDPKTGVFTTLGSYGKYNNTGGVALDGHGNLYAGALYSNIIAKVPYINGAYAALTDATQGTAPANCTGTDTTECVVAPVAATSGIGGVSAMAFDSNGDLFIGTDDQGNNPWSIWECTAACLATGSPAPVMIFQEPAGNNSSTTVGQYYTGGLALDPWGNLFFTDSYLLNQSSNASKSTKSDLYYLPISTGTGFGGVTTGYAAAPTLLQTFTNVNPTGYDDELDGVAVGSDGTVYYALQYDGVFAFPNTQASGPNIATQYAVTSQGAKEVALDAHGNIFYVSYNNGGDSLGEIQVNNLTTPIGQLQGAAVTAPATVVDNVFGCGTAAILALASSDPQFSATAGTTCSSIAVSSGNGTLTTAVAGASSYPATISFAATKGGAQHAILTVTDTSNGGLGTANVTGVGQETPQTITFTAPTTTTFTYAPALTVTLGATGGGSNNPVTFTVDPGSTGAGTIANTTLTVTRAGNIIIDADQAGGLVNGIYYDNATRAQLTLTINKAAQSITFAAQGTSATFAPGLTITLSAAGGASTSPVVFSVDSGVATTGAGTISGNVLTVTQAGNIVIDANQAADSNYGAALQVQQTFVVNKATQTITFIPLSQPLHYITGGLQISISATGGAANKPIVFAVDSASPVQGTFSASKVSGSTSTATLTIMDQASLASFPANIVIDATQPGDANYADAAQAAETISLLKPLPTQMITFDNPGTQVAGTPLPLAATATSGFPVTYSATPSSACTVTSSQSGWTANFVNTNTTAAACTITAYQPGDNIYFAAAAAVSQTFAVNPTGQAPSMNMSLSFSSLTIQTGTVGLTQITVNSVNNFTGQVSFACSGAPSGYSCNFNPSTVSAFTADATSGLPKGTTGSTQLSIGGGSTAAVHANPRPLLPVATLAVALCFLGFRKRNRLQFLLLAGIAIGGLGLFSGCGGSSSAKTKPPVTSQITITATSGKATQSATLTLIVE